MDPVYASKLLLCCEIGLTTSCFAYLWIPEGTLSIVIDKKFVVGSSAIVAGLVAWKFIG